MDTKVEALKKLAVTITSANSEKDIKGETVSDVLKYINDNYQGSGGGGGSITTDSTPTENSTNPVQSGGVYNELKNKQDKIVGTDGQILSFDTDGNLIAKDAPTSEVISFNGRKGEITPQDGDYTADMVGAEPAGASNTALNDAKAYTNEKIAELIDSAPDTLNTLNELATALQSNETVVETLEQSIGNKANQSSLEQHTTDQTIHITAAERLRWDSKQDIVTGTEGQYVGFDAAGIATAKNFESTINDAKIGTNTTWSSKKISDELNLLICTCYMNEISSGQYEFANVSMSGIEILNALTNEKDVVIKASNGHNQIALRFLELSGDATNKMTFGHTYIDMESGMPVLKQYALSIDINDVIQTNNTSYTLQ